MKNMAEFGIISVGPNGESYWNLIFLATNRHYNTLYYTIIGNHKQCIIKAEVCQSVGMTCCLADIGIQGFFATQEKLDNQQEKRVNHQIVGGVFGQETLPNIQDLERSQSRITLSMSITLFHVTGTVFCRLFGSIFNYGTES